MIRMFEDYNYSSNRNTTYGDQKMVEEFNKPYKEKTMSSYTTQADQYDNIFIHKVSAETFWALEKFAGVEGKGDEAKYLSFNIGNVQITAFQKEEGNELV